MPRLDTFDLTVCFLEGAVAAYRVIHQIVYRPVHHAQHRLAVFYQRDHGRKVTAAGDEFLSTVQWIHQPVSGPAAALGQRHLGAFFRQHRDIGQLAQCLLEINVSGQIGAGDRAVVIFVLGLILATVIQ